MKKLTRKELAYIENVSELIKNGEATKTQITDAYFLLTQNCVDNDERINFINRWMKTEYYEHYVQALEKEVEYARARAMYSEERLKRVISGLE